MAGRVDPTAEHEGSSSKQHGSPRKGIAEDERLDSLPVDLQCGAPPGFAPSRGAMPPSLSDPPGPDSLLNPTDRLRAVYLLASEFVDDEPTTAMTDPPNARTSIGPAFCTEPIDRPILLRMDGVQAGNVVSLTTFPCFIGRSPSSSILVDDAGVSRHHAQITHEEDDLIIRDLGSRNGTFIDGQRITSAPLADGCLIQIGIHVGYRFTLVDARQEKLLRELYESSTRDALTGLYNRRHFDDRMTAELAYTKRHSTDLSLVIVDIDFFKKINDTYGHATGDLVLKHVATTLSKQLRAEDILARIGGEEFAVLLRGVAPDGAFRLAERLRYSIETSMVLSEGSTIKPTISLGCAAVSELGDATGKALFAFADDRLYAAKRNGRNRVVGSQSTA